MQDSSYSLLEDFKTSIISQKTEKFFFLLYIDFLNYIFETSGYYKPLEKSISNMIGKNKASDYLEAKIKNDLLEILTLIKEIISENKVSNHRIDEGLSNCEAILKNRYYSSKPTVQLLHEALSYILLGIFESGNGNLVKQFLILEKREGGEERLIDYRISEDYARYLAFFREMIRIADSSIAPVWFDLEKFYQVMFRRSDTNRELLKGNIFLDTWGFRVLCDNIDYILGSKKNLEFNTQFFLREKFEVHLTRLILYIKVNNLKPQKANKKIDRLQTKFNLKKPTISQKVKTLIVLGEEINLTKQQYGICKIMLNGSDRDEWNYGEDIIPHFYPNDIREISNLCGRINQTLRRVNSAVKNKVGTDIFIVHNISAELIRNFK